MTANRFKYKVWIRQNMDADLCDVEDGLDCTLKKGWLKDHREIWFYLSPNGQELQWGLETDVYEPLSIGRDVDVCFSTGLLDKSGKEIFEGDVVKGKGWDSLGIGLLNDIVEIEIVYTVKWNQELLEWFAFDVLQPDDSIAFCDVDTPEIIGNIYENPGLLEVTKC